MNNRYTTEEIKFIVTTYVNNPGFSRLRKADVANSHFTNNTHSHASWAACFGQLEKLDNRNPNATEFVISKNLQVTAEDIAPHIFA